MKERLTALFAVVLFSPLLAFADEGKLARVRDEVRSSSASGQDDKKATNDDIDDDGMFDEMFHDLGLVYIAGVRESFALPTLFAPYPYASGASGYLLSPRMLLSPPPNADEMQGYSLPERPVVLDPTALKRRSWAARASVEEGNDFNGLNRIGGQVVLDTESHFGFQTSWNVYHERLTGGHTDELFVGDANIFLRLLSLEMFQDRVGVGVRCLSEPGRADFGVNVLYAQDWFPIRPVVFSHALEFGTLGDADVFHYRATLGCVWSHVEVFGGYDVLRIGSVSLDGPLVGVRVWF